MKLSFNNLLRPYRAGGTESHPKRRTLETISSALVTRYNFTPEEAGAAILKVFYLMAEKGLAFKGDGTYGSEGRELFSCIRAQAQRIKEDQVMQEVKLELANQLHCYRLGCPKRSHDTFVNEKLGRVIFAVTKPWMLSVYGGVFGAGTVYGGFYLGLFKKIAEILGII